MIDQETNIEVKHLMPKMDGLKSVDAIPLLNTVVMAKADGEFSVIYYDAKTCYIVNQYGRMRGDFPAINELCDALIRRGLIEAVLLSELYAVENGRPLTLHKFLSRAKGRNKIPESLRIGVFDLLRIDGETVKEDYGWKMDEVSEWLRGCHYCHVLPYIRAENHLQIRKFWKEYVEEIGFEGIVAHAGGKIWKVKPSADVDAVVIGLNKRELFDQKQITSLKTALMEEDGTLIELTDVASGINHDLRSFLWRLMEYKVGEDRETVYIKPLVVCTVEYQETYKEDSKGEPILKRRWSFEEGRYIERDKRAFVSLRFPRLIGFRSDKTLDPKDLRLTQIP